MNNKTRYAAIIAAITGRGSGPRNEPSRIAGHSQQGSRDRHHSNYGHRILKTVESMESDSHHGHHDHMTWEVVEAVEHDVSTGEGTTYSRDKGYFNTFLLS
jgi:hypothetical protein